MAKSTKKATKTAPTARRAPVKKAPGDQKATKTAPTKKTTAKKASRSLSPSGDLRPRLEIRGWRSYTSVIATGPSAAILKLKARLMKEWPKTRIDTVRADTRLELFAPTIRRPDEEMETARHIVNAFKKELFDAGVSIVMKIDFI